MLMSGNQSPDYGALSPSRNVANVEVGVTESTFVSESKNTVTTTKYRVANICCGKEADLIKKELDGVAGIKAVNVNLVGRLAHIKHDTQLLTAANISERLNKLHLGISIMETGTAGKTETDQRERIKIYLKITNLIVITCLLVTLVVSVVKKYTWKKWVAVPLIILGGLPILWKALVDIRRLVLANINLLMLIAVAGTIALHEWLDGAIIIYVFCLADILQKYSKYKVQKDISELMLSTPEVAVLAETNKSVPVEDVPMGTLIVIVAGERIALDGEVVKGSAAVDESSITGESNPVSKKVGSSVYGGTVIQSGYLRVKTTCEAGESTMSRVKQMVEEAQSKSSRTEEVLNKFAKFYTPLVLTTSLLLFLIPFIVFKTTDLLTEKDIETWGKRALIILVVACPCALIMAVPIPMVCGITQAAHMGALIKGGTFLERLAKVKLIAFDKTGTLTEGRFQVLNEKVVNDDGLDAIRLAAALETKSSHPLAACIVNHYSGCITDKISDFGVNVGLPEVTKFKNEDGLGLSGVIEEHSVYVGNLELLEKLNTEIDPADRVVFNEWSDDGQTVVFIIVDGRLCLMLGMADKCRESAKDTISALSKMGVETVMITGDNAGVAEVMQRKVGISEYQAGMKPDDKLAWIESRKMDVVKEKKKRKILAMIGDGINDGPSLAASDVGIAIGSSATALAVQSAGISLMSDNLMKIPALIRLSKSLRFLIFQNIFGALLIKVIFVIAALAGKEMLWLAVLSDVLGLLFVVVNGLRPLRWKENTQLEIEYSDVVENDQEKVQLVVKNNTTV